MSESFRIVCATFMVTAVIHLLMGIFEGSFDVHYWSVYSRIITVALIGVVWTIAILEVVRL